MEKFKAFAPVRFAWMGMRSERTPILSETNVDRRHSDHYIGS